MIARPPSLLGVLGGTDEDAGHDLLARAHVGDDRLHVLGRQPIEDRAVGLASGQLAACPDRSAAT